MQIVLVVEDQTTCDGWTSCPIRLEHKRIRLKIVVKYNAVCSPEIVPQGTRQLSANGAVLQTLSQPLCIDKYDLGCHSVLEGENPPSLRPAFLGASLHERGQRVIGQDRRFFPVSQLAIEAALEPGEADGQGSGGSVQTQGSERVDVLRIISGFCSSWASISRVIRNVWGDFFSGR